MTIRHLLVAILLGICANANAEWFLRGTHNAWAASQMESAGSGTNTMQLKSVVFTSAGNIKFDRFGDWKENYGVGGLSGSNIAVAAGTWDIKFFTDTKKWSIAASTTYHVRGTFNTWLEGTLMARIGATDNYALCANFTGGDANGGPRFKIDPNGGWGDGIPSTDFLVTVGWVNITFNSVSKTITVEQNLAANCSDPVSSSSASSSSAIVTTPSTVVSSSSSKSSIASSSLVKSSTISSSSLASSSSSKSSTVSSAASSAAASIYHVRGTFNGWAEGTLMNRIGVTDNYEFCANFTGTNTRFKIDPNGGWGDGIPAADFVVTPGWVKISFNSTSKTISVQQNLATNCVVSSSSSSAPASIYHVRGTFNSWAEGTLMNRIGSTDNYEFCVNFIGTNTRFKIDPNGGWGDGIPAADFVVTPGWVKILFNSTAKSISVQQNLTANCGVVTSSSSVSSLPPEDFIFPNEPVYHLRGNFNGWAEGVLMLRNTPIFPSYYYDLCVHFTDDTVNPVVRLDPNGGWGVDMLPATGDFVLPKGSGWTGFDYDRQTGIFAAHINREPNCANTDIGIGRREFPADTVIISQPASGGSAFVPIHVRGTNNGWVEGTLMSQIGTTDAYEACINFETGDANGGPRFRIDPNGGWGDAVPTTDLNVPAGWVRIGFNNTTKAITKQTNMRKNCIPDTYALMGTQRTDLDKTEWMPGDFFELVDGSPQVWKICRNFVEGDDFGGPRFRIIVNNDTSSVSQSNSSDPTFSASGWTAITFTAPSSSAERDQFTPPENVRVTKNMAPNCSAP